VATRVGGIPELVRDGRDGLLTYADPASIAAALRSVLTGPSCLRSMASSATRRARESGWDRLVEDTEAVYAELASARRSSRGLRSNPVLPHEKSPYPLVLHVIGSLRIGGTERQLVQFIQRSSNPERHVVAVLQEPGAQANEIPTPPLM